MIIGFFPLWIYFIRDLIDRMSDDAIRIREISVDVETLNIVLLVMAPFFLFAGKRIFRPFLFAVSAIFGAYFAYFASVFFKNKGYKTPSPETMLLIELFSGLVVALLTLKFLSLGIMISGGIIGVLLLNLLYGFLVTWTDLLVYVSDDFRPYIQLIIFIVGFGLGALLARYIFTDFLVPALTAILGGYMLVAGISFFLFKSGAIDDPSPFSVTQFFSPDKSIDLMCTDIGCYGLLALWALSSIIGAAVQTRIFPTVPAPNSRKENSSFDAA